MPNALLKFSYNAPVPSVLTLVVGNKLRVKLEAIDKRQKLVAVSDIPHLLDVSGTHNSRADSWAFVITAMREGNAKLAIQVQQGAGAPMLTITPPLVNITIKKQVSLPDAASDVGMLVRLFLAEAPAPQTWPDTGVTDIEDAKQGMRMMRRVLHNRLNSKKPQDFGAPNARSITDIVRASTHGVQFLGFDQYPKLGGGQEQTINGVLALVNDATNLRWNAQYTAFYNAALEVATENLAPDPSPTGLFGWRTARSGAPSRDFSEFKTSGGNTFFTHAIQRISQ
ncbi:hypothetical protein [Acidovorax sp. NCPPB 3576]|uniref:hypothetical protein n=1 Tax=Acidovorax sp. NCPPB 3576 TaxID=2940488 RepID=UPI00234AB9E1|nr:hypothetical protein [Acidovorax sp. NCPPB 3576]WCM88275.1 hypothetical protein M5C98_23550 [Acidovorax sp. NCPPB 3576]